MPCTHGEERPNGRSCSDEREGKTRSSALKKWSGTATLGTWETFRLVRRSCGRRASGPR